MKKNIMVIGYDYEKSLNLANRLADYFSMRVLSEVELFEFDFVPRTLDEMVKLKGAQFVKDKLGGEARLGASYENIIFVADLNLADTGKAFFTELVGSYIIIYLSKKLDIEEAELSQKKYSESERQIFYFDKESLRQKGQVMSELCDVHLEIDEMSELDIYFRAIGDIKRIYNMN